VVFFLTFPRVSLIPPSISGIFVTSTPPYVLISMVFLVRDLSSGVFFWVPIDHQGFQSASFRITIRPPTSQNPPSTSFGDRVFFTKPSKFMFFDGLQCLFHSPFFPCGFPGPSAEPHVKSFSRGFSLFPCFPTPLRFSTHMRSGLSPSFPGKVPGIFFSGITPKWLASPGDVI